MPRLKSPTGVIVSVSDANAEKLLTRGFTKITSSSGSSEPAKKAAPRKAAKKS